MAKQLSQSRRNAWIQVTVQPGILKIDKTVTKILFTERQCCSTQLVLSKNCRIAFTYISFRV